MQQWHDVAKDARRVGVAENQGGTVHAKEVELDGLDSLLLLADDLRVLHSGLGVRAHCCHDPAHTSASSPGGAAKGLRVRDFDPAHLLLGHLRAALADAERGERDVDSVGVRRNLLLEPVHVDNHLGDFGVGEGVGLAARHHHHLSAQRVPDQKLHDAPAHIPRRAQHDGRVLRLRLCRCGWHRQVIRARNKNTRKAASE